MATESPRRSPASCSSAATRWLAAYNSPYDTVSPSATIRAVDCGALIAWSEMFTRKALRVRGFGRRRLSPGLLGGQHLVLEHLLDQALHVGAERGERNEVVR